MAILTVLSMIFFVPKSGADITPFPNGLQRYATFLNYQIFFEDFSHKNEGIEEAEAFPKRYLNNKDKMFTFAGLVIRTIASSVCII